MQPVAIDYTELSFPEPTAERPYVAINMVMSADGRTVVEGAERGIGSAVDQRLMRELRVHFDVVLNGAATFRASGTSARLNDPRLERWRLDRGMSASPIAAVLTQSGDLPPERRFFTDHSFDAWVYLSSAAPVAVRRQLKSRGRPVVVIPQGDEARAALSHMQSELGARRVLVEGGAKLNGELLQQDLVDEYFLTLAPQLIGGDSAHAAVYWNGEPSRAQVRTLTLMHALHAETGELFLRYAVERAQTKRQD